MLGGRAVRVVSGGSLGDLAARYAAAGIAVFPLKAGGKRPATSHGFKDATTDAAQVATWWASMPMANIGMPTGAMFDVIDLDSTEAVAAFEVLRAGGVVPEVIGRARTPRGEHVYIRPTGDGIGAGIRPGMDYRGVGGYVVAPGSRQPDGSVREWVEPLDLAALTGEPTGVSFIDAVRAHDGAEPAAGPLSRRGGTQMAPGAFEGGTSRWAAAALHGEVERVRQADEGVRNDTLNRAAFSLGQLVAGGELVEAEVIEALESEALAVGLARSETTATIRSGLAAGAKNPRAMPTAIPNSGWASDASPAGEDAVPSSWASIDLTGYLDGSARVEEPDLLRRTDGRGLLYRGKVSDLHGESESGKSFVVQAETARVLADGGTVLYLDFESDAATVVGRLIALGAPREAVHARFDYRRPDAAPTVTDLDAILTRRFDFAVLDGVTDALGLSGKSSKDNDEVAAWLRGIARPLAARTGAAVVLVDHVTKSTEGRGRFAIGAQAKLSGLNGASYVVEVVEPLGRGLRGVLVLYVAKDRPGGVRGHCGPARTDRTQEAARIVVDSTDPARIVVEVQPPATAAGAGSEPGGLRPTAIMEKASRVIECEDTSTTVIVKAVRSRKVNVLTALTCLVAEGFAVAYDGPHGARMHRSLRPYRQATDPASDRFDGHEDADHGREQVSGPPQPLGRCSTCSGP